MGGGFAEDKYLLRESSISGAIIYRTKPFIFTSALYRIVLPSLTTEGPNIKSNRHRIEIKQMGFCGNKL